MRRAYQTDLSDEEWSYIEPHLPTPKAPGSPRVHTLREILDAIFSILRSGCAWRLLPHDFPPWKTVHHYFRTWRLDGTWERVHAALRKRLQVRNLAAYEQYKARELVDLEHSEEDIERAVASIPD
jgi:putative transposase